MAIIPLCLVISFILLMYLLFYKVISNKWIPNKNTFITIAVGIYLIFGVLPFEQAMKDVITSDNLRIVIWAFTEEFIKLLAILIILRFNKFSKLTFLEILGIGIGFSLFETFLFSYYTTSFIYSGVTASLPLTLMAITWRFLGALILHMFTVGIMALAIVYIKKKKDLFIIFALFVSFYSHYLFNKYIITNNSENFLPIFLVFNFLFVSMFVFYIFIDGKINLIKTKTVIFRIIEFKLKYISFFILCLGIIVIFDLITIPGLKNYSIQEIGQAKIHQNEIRKKAQIWQIEDINNFKENEQEILRIKELYNEIDNTYSDIINTMEENRRKLTREEAVFLKTKGSELVKDALEISQDL